MVGVAFRCANQSAPLTTLVRTALLTCVWAAASDAATGTRVPECWESFLWRLCDTAKMLAKVVAGQQETMADI